MLGQAGSVASARADSQNAEPFLAPSRDASAPRSSRTGSSWGSPARTAHWSASCPGSRLTARAAAVAPRSRPFASRPGGPPPTTDAAPRRSDRASRTHRRTACSSPCPAIRRRSCRRFACDGLDRRRRRVTDFGGDGRVAEVRPVVADRPRIEILPAVGAASRVPLHRPLATRRRYRRPSPTDWPPHAYTPIQSVPAGARTRTGATPLTCAPLRRRHIHHRRGRRGLCASSAATGSSSSIYCTLSEVSPEQGRFTASSASRGAIESVDIRT